MPGLGAREFAALIARCGPFEPRPLLAVAVSGGADSLALALLAHEWARTRRGRVVALTVDHRLRRGSGAEAKRVGRWLGRHGVAQRVLVWRGAKPATGLQEAARAARYALLADWCRAAGALHLLLGHTLDDQAETVLLRLAAGSGPHGLAAMPAVHELAGVRLLRPLLGIAHERLEATLAERRQEWIEDPSNRDERFARVRVRGALAHAADPSALKARIAHAAAELGRNRAADERAIAAALARAVELRREGYARADLAALAAEPPSIGWRALAALLATVGGLAYPPRGDAVRRLLADLAGGRRSAGTLGRCRLMRDRAGWLVTREARGLEAIAPAQAARRVVWDGRHALALPPGHGVAALGAQGWAALVAAAPKLRTTDIPYPARLALPALRDRRGRLVAVAGLAWRRKNAAMPAFRPRRPLAPAFFAADSLA